MIKKWEIFKKVYTSEAEMDFLNSTAQQHHSGTNFERGQIAMFVVNTYVVV